MAFISRDLLFTIDSKLNPLNRNPLDCLATKVTHQLSMNKNIHVVDEPKGCKVIKACRKNMERDAIFAFPEGHFFKQKMTR